MAQDYHGMIPNAQGGAALGIRTPAPPEQTSSIEDILQAMRSQAVHAERLVEQANEIVVRLTGPAPATPPENPVHGPVAGFISEANFLLDRNNTALKDLGNRLDRLRSLI